MDIYRYPYIVCDILHIWMRITAKIAEDMVGVLEEIKEEVFPKDQGKYPFAEWERKGEATIETSS